MVHTAEQKKDEKKNLSNEQVEKEKEEKLEVKKNKESLKS